MKKVLVLLMIIGMVSAASAAIMDGFELNMKTPGVVTVVGLDLDEVIDIPLGLYDPPGTISNPQVLEAAGDLGAVTQWDGYNGFDMQLFSTTGGGIVEPWVGDWFTFDYTGSVGDMVDVYEYESNAAGAYVGSMEIIPEPITIALMGIGGLFLRRRK
jgi:hypothetical protein